MTRNFYRSPLLYVVAGVGMMALLLVAVRVVGPPTPSAGDDEAALVSPDGRVQTDALSDRGRGMFSRSLIDALGPTFGPLYEPGYVPKGYVPQGGPYASPTIMERVGVGIRQVALNNEVVVPYMSQGCQLNVHQHRRGAGQGPDIARRAIEYPSETVVSVTHKGTAIQSGYRAEYASAHGIELYVSGPVAMPGPERESTFAEYWFERGGTWFSIEMWAWPGCDTLSLNEIARIASSMTRSS